MADRVSKTGTPEDPEQPEAHEATVPIQADVPVLINESVDSSNDSASRPIAARTRSSGQRTSSTASQSLVSSRGNDSQDTMPTGEMRNLSERVFEDGDRNEHQSSSGQSKKKEKESSSSSTAVEPTAPIVEITLSSDTESSETLESSSHRSETSSEEGTQERPQPPIVEITLSSDTASSETLESSSHRSDTSSEDGTRARPIIVQDSPVSSSDSYDSYDEQSEVSDSDISFGRNSRGLRQASDATAENDSGSASVPGDHVASASRQGAAVSSSGGDNVLTATFENGYSTRSVTKRRKEDMAFREGLEALKLARKRRLEAKKSAKFPEESSPDASGENSTSDEDEVASTSAKKSNGPSSSRRSKRNK